MNQDEEREVETLIDEIKKERKMNIMGQRDIVQQNMRVASEYRQFREHKYNSTVFYQYSL